MTRTFAFRKIFFSLLFDIALSSLSSAKLDTPMATTVATLLSALAQKVTSSSLLSFKTTNTTALQIPRRLNTHFDAQRTRTNIIARNAVIINLVQWSLGFVDLKHSNNSSIRNNNNAPFRAASTERQEMFGTHYRYCKTIMLIS